ncbi:MAG: hypothetical protein RBJ76_04050 [Stenomitos frigidus ULC029]
MAHLLKKLLQWLAGGTYKLMTLAVIVLLAWGTFAPVGTLVWWLNQSTDLGKKRQPKQLPANEGNAPIARDAEINCYIIYLSGVGDFSTDQLTPGEEWFLDQLVRLHPNCVVVRDVFPYSVANKDLGGQRLLAPVWQAIEHGNGWLENADVLIKIRNLWRLAISADDRYGSVYNQGIADAMIERMNAVQPFPRDRQQPLNVVLIGTSGGVQVALGAIPYLDRWLKARLTVVSLGGTFNGEEGFGIADHVYHLHGERDWIENIGSVVFPSRWRWTVASPFNQARQQGRYTALSSGAHAHDGQEGYLGLAIARPQTTFATLTLQKVQQLPIWKSPQQDQASRIAGE